MRRKLLFATLLASVLAGVFAVFSITASAVQRTFLVKLPTGNVIRVTVDAPAGVPMDAVPGLPGTPIQELTPPGGGDGGGDPSGDGGGNQGGDKPSTPSGDGGSQNSGGDGGSSGGSDKPSPKGGKGQDGDRGEKKPDRPSNEPQSKDEKERAEEREDKKKDKDRPRATPDRNSDGTPTRNNPTFFDALPTPTPGSAVPNFVIRKFQVPIFLLPIYQAAGIQYGIRWEILAAINEIETDYGRNLNVSSAGALGWMQFIPSSWKAYGVDANDDGKKDPYNPVDAIFAAANYLKAAGAEKDIRRAIFAYNHADWYVDSVMLRAKLIAGVPGDLVGSLTGLTQGRFPVAARARYADDVLEREMKRRVKRGENAAAVLEDADRRSIDIFSENGAPVVAANDGVIKKVGEDDKLGRYIVLQDVYGNRYTYAGLGSVSQLYPVPKVDVEVDDNAAPAISANAGKPSAPASAGRQPADDASRVSTETDAETKPSAGRGTVVYKPRIFAHPYRPNARKNGGLEQIFNRATTQKGFATYKGLFAHVYGLNADNAVLRPLKKGSRVVAGTLLGRVGRPDPSKAAHLTFSIRPAGRGAPTIDPKPILDGWKLLESTAIYRANGKNALYSSSDAFSIGQILLLPKPLLQKRVLSDERVEIYPGGRADIRAGQIDRRVLATLEFLAESGLRPTVTSLRTGHSKFTSSGNVSHHWHGSAVDIAQINGVSILGHQDKGGVTEQAVKRLMLLQGTMRPDQIISLLDYGANTVSMGDHHDHIHVGFRPLFGENAKLGQQTMAVLKPGQWSSLIDRLKQLENPVVPTKPSKYALPADKKKKRSSHAHRGE